MSRAISTVKGINVLGAIVAVMWIAAWGMAIAHRSFDYDELEHTYAIWLIRNGARPFYDFFECHPPFLWYPLGIPLRLLGDRYAILFIFRALTALGHVAMLVAMGLNVALSFQNLRQPRAL
ncbi:MAG: hypothetical protein H7X95_02515, partial [Deltaproteobacteria bacterium]|nr:hypothetical protein [Deltaproteobacteria bacterium]